MRWRPCSGLWSRIGGSIGDGDTPSSLCSSNNWRRNVLLLPSPPLSYLHLIFKDAPFRTLYHLSARLIIDRRPVFALPRWSSVPPTHPTLLTSSPKTFPFSFPAEGRFLGRVHLDGWGMGGDFSLPQEDVLLPPLIGCEGGLGTSAAVGKRRRRGLGSCWTERGGPGLNYSPAPLPEEGRVCAVISLLWRGLEERSNGN